MNMGFLRPPWHLLYGHFRTALVSGFYITIINLNKKYSYVQRCAINNAGTNHTNILPQQKEKRTKTVILVPISDVIVHFDKDITSN